MVNIFQITFFDNHYFGILRWHFELFELIDVINLEKYLFFFNNIEFNNLYVNNEFSEKDFFEWYKLYLQNIPKLYQLALVINCYIVSFFFFKITSLTFWLIPPISLLIVGLVLLFFIAPLGGNKIVWTFSKIILLGIIFYQFILLLLYVDHYIAGFQLKVGFSGTYILPFNLGLAKVFSFLFILFSLLITLFFTLDFYSKTLLLIKPELVPTLFFLGFGSGMVFLQNDLFSIFLYFEIISFCIYGLLFFQKWTNTQLHGLIWYVIFSLWISTCYIIGIAFYLSSVHTTTSLNSFGSHLVMFEKILISGNNLSMIDFESILSISFILIYFFFKLGIGPFYTWILEVYNSCNLNILFAISIIPKMVYFPVLFFFLFFNFIEYYSFWTSLLFILGFLTVMLGSFGILFSNKLKEIYAWSSIIHTGNLTIILSSISIVSLTFVMFYLISYYLISLGFIVLLTSTWNTLTGRFIKNINELNSLYLTSPIISFLAIILIASAAGFTPFLSFFMKFSLLSIISNNYGVIVTIVIGLLNIIGSVAYLRMLWNIVGFNFDIYTVRAKDNIFVSEVKLSYKFGLIFNLISLLILFSFVFYQEFLTFFQFFWLPYYLYEEHIILTLT